MTTALGVNVQGGMLAGQGIAVNGTTVNYVGSNRNAPGIIVTGTVLETLYQCWLADPDGETSLYTIGETTVPALGNSFAGLTSPAVGRNRGYTGILADYAQAEYGGGIPQFVGAFQAYASWAASTNLTINSAVQSKTYLNGGYSNMEDLITADIMGVNKDVVDFGQDLQNLGRAINPSRLATFGTPQNLLLTLYESGALILPLLTQLALNFTNSEIEDLRNPIYVPTLAQQQKLYKIFQKITGSRLQQILVALQCVTQGLSSLADLLSPIKLFPLSYTTLTVPFYQFNNGSIKTYDFIFVANDTNPRIPSSLGAYLLGMIPNNIAIACGALATSLLQVQNITSVTLPQFAVSVKNLETLKDLPLANPVGVPVNPAAVNTILGIYAHGSGANGTYTMCDFFGIMSGVDYNTWYTSIYTLINQVTTPELRQAYANLLLAVESYVPDPPPPAPPPDVPTYNPIPAAVAAVETEIERIQNIFPVQVQQLNANWQRIQTQYSIEVAARSAALVDIVSILPANRTSIIGFADNIGYNYYRDTVSCGTANVLEQVADQSNVTGQSIIALMRESRNRDRLGLTGIGTNTNIDPPLPLPVYTPGIAPGVVTGFDFPNPQAPGGMYPVLNTQTNWPLIPSEYTPQEAVDSVTTCNCDCWQK